MKLYRAFRSIEMSPAQALWYLAVAKVTRSERTALLAVEMERSERRLLGGNI